LTNTCTLWKRSANAGPTVRCSSEGDTRDEAAESIRSAIAEMIETLAELGEPAPLPDLKGGHGKIA
jgi:hypothetical protein